jgi:hypothetical protein
MGPHCSDCALGFLPSRGRLSPVDVFFRQILLLYPPFNFAKGFFDVSLKVSSFTPRCVHLVVVLLSTFHP